MMPDLGKYAFSVLSAYGVSLVLIIGLVLLSIQRSKKARVELEKVEGRKNG